jgi:hypothetical protein
VIHGHTDPELACVYIHCVHDPPVSRVRSACDERFTTFLERLLVSPDFILSSDCCRRHSPLLLSSLSCTCFACLYLLPFFIASSRVHSESVPEPFEFIVSASSYARGRVFHHPSNPILRESVCVLSGSF